MFVLNDDQPYGFGIAEAFRVTAERSGLRVVGTAAWDTDAGNYRALAERVRSVGTDAVYLGGYVSNNGVRLIEDLRETLGSDVLIIGPDGFATPGLIVEGAGPDAEGFTWTIPTLPNEELSAPGGELAADFEERYSSAPCCFAVQAAQSAALILDAIEDSDGSRRRCATTCWARGWSGGTSAISRSTATGTPRSPRSASIGSRTGGSASKPAVVPPAELLARR